MGAAKRQILENCTVRRHARPWYHSGIPRIGMLVTVVCVTLSVCATCRGLERFVNITLRSTSEAAGDATQVQSTNEKDQTAYKYRGARNSALVGMETSQGRVFSALANQRLRVVRELTGGPHARHLGIVVRAAVHSARTTLSRWREHSPLVSSRT